MTATLPADRFTGFFQSGWVVSDLDAAMAAWLGRGIGPFFVVRRVMVEDISYRGTPATLDFSVAFAQAGAMQIELIAQHDDRPSHYRDSYAQGRSGFHHLCRFTADIDAEIAAAGQAGDAIACAGRSGDMRFVYVDTRAQLGCMTEIIEDRPTMRGFFEMIADAAIGWDGADPVRVVG